MRRYSTRKLAKVIQMKIVPVLQLASFWFFVNWIKLCYQFLIVFQISQKLWYQNIFIKFNYDSMKEIARWSSTLSHKYLLLKIITFKNSHGYKQFDKTGIESIFLRLVRLSYLPSWVCKYVFLLVCNHMIKIFWNGDFNFYFCCSN